MIRALIADDELLARKLILEYLRAHADIEVVAECDNGRDAVRQIGVLQPDLVFLDIRMPGLSGLEVLDATGRRDGIVFTTAYDAHALQAFDRNAVDYLLKPFSQSRFDAALARARTLIGVAQPALAAVLSQAGPPLERIVIREREQLHMIRTATVTCIEAQDDYVAIYSEGRCFLKTQRLGDLEQLLDPARFLRVHRSWLVNLACIDAVERSGRDGHVLRLQDGRRLPVSRAGYARLRARMPGL